MQNFLYQNSDDFFLLDYSPSHSEMVFRCFDRKTETNIDIFFKGVKYINIIPKLSGVKIYQESDKVLLLQYGVKDSRHYVIQDNNERRFSIISYFFCVSSNRLNLLQSSLGDIFWSSENDIIFESSS